MQRIGIDTAGENLAAVRLHRVVGARQTRDAVEQDDHIFAVFDLTLGHFDHHFRDLDVTLRRFIKR